MLYISPPLDQRWFSLVNVIENRELVSRTVRFLNFECALNRLYGKSNFLIVDGKCLRQDDMMMHEM